MINGIMFDPRIIEAARAEHEFVEVKVIPVRTFDRIKIIFGILPKTIRIKIKRRSLCELIPRVTNLGVYADYKIKDKKNKNGKN